MNLHSNSLVTFDWFEQVRLSILQLLSLLWFDIELMPIKSLHLQFFSILFQSCTNFSVYLFIEVTSFDMPPLTHKLN